MRLIRGQNAVEYLMTYGWALLIILIALVLMWQLGFLEQMRNVTPGKHGFTQIMPFDWAMASDGTFEVSVRNDAGTLVMIDSSYTDAYMLVGGSGECFASVPQALVDGMRPASSGTVAYYGCALVNGIKPGDYYRVNVTIAYNDPGSGLPHRSNGILFGPVT